MAADVQRADSRISECDKQNALSRVVSARYSNLPSEKTERECQRNCLRVTRALGGLTGRMTTSWKEALEGQEVALGVFGRGGSGRDNGPASVQ